MQANTMLIKGLSALTSSRPSAAGDRTEDISRLFIYYVGRKKDQPLGPKSLKSPSEQATLPRGESSDAVGAKYSKLSTV